MNVDLLAKFVIDALKNQGNVCIPYVGTFSIVNEPARIASNGYVILPPSIKVDFQEAFPAGTDVTLAQMLASEKKLQLATAISRLDTFCKEFRKVLAESKCVVLPGLGKVRATKENDLFFVPDNELELGGEYFCLEPIHMKVSEQEGAQVKVEIPEASPESAAQGQEAAAQGQEGQGQEARSGKKSRKGLIAAIVITTLAAAAVAAFVVVSRMMPGSTDFLLYSSEELELLRYIL